MIAAIDADSLIYIIAWNHREHYDETLVKESCDSFLRDILTLTGSTQYLGVFSGHKCFRHRIYKFAEYKGNRKEKEEWTIRWEKTIKDHYINKHGFVTAVDLEADDVVAAMCTLDWEGVVICSPDKDLKQIPGWHYDYRAQVKKVDFDASEVIREGMLMIPDAFAYRFFWTQMLTGDPGDGVYGIIGMGDVKAKKLLDECMDPMMYFSVVKGAYKKAYGPHYGEIIFWETYDTLMLIGPKHRLWNSDSVTSYKIKIAMLTDSIKTLTTAKGIFDV